MTPWWVTQVVRIPTFVGDRLIGRLSQADLDRFSKASVDLVVLCAEERDRREREGSS
jgi:hypothetical protein